MKRIENGGGFVGVGRLDAVTTVDFGSKDLGAEIAESGDTNRAPNTTGTGMVSLATNGGC